MGLFKWWNERREVCAMVAQTNLLDATAVEEKKLADERAVMLSNPCAVNGMAPCHDTCVHFSAGKVFIMDDAYGGKVPVKISPRCKLWRD